MKYLVKNAPALKREWENGDIVEINNLANSPLVADLIEKGWLEQYDGPEPYKHVIVMADPASLTDNAPQPNG